MSEQTQAGSIWGACEEPEPEVDLEWEAYQKNAKLKKEWIAMTSLVQGYFKGVVARHGTWIAARNDMGISAEADRNCGYYNLLNRNPCEENFLPVSRADLDKIMPYIHAHMDKTGAPL